MRKLVLPGENISSEEKRIGNGVIRTPDGLTSSLLGLLDEKEQYVRVIPLSGGYDPKEGDFVIGVVSQAQGTFWRLDIGAPYSAILPGGEYYRELRGKERLRDILSIGSTVYVKIKEVTKTKGVFTTMKWGGTKTLKEGTILEITPSKIPRIIGKRDSMVNILREESGCEILPGQNGAIWINGPVERIDLAIEAIRYIEKNSQKSGLTDYIKNLLIKKRSNL